MGRTTIAALAAAFATIYASSGAAAELDRMRGGVRRAEQEADSGFEHRLRGLRALRTPQRRIELGVVPGGSRQPVLRKPGLKAVGVSRPLPSDTLVRGEWAATAEGRRVWRLAIKSDDADSMRVRFANFHAGAGQVWVMGATASAGPYTGNGPFGDGTFWSDMVDGDSVVVAWEPADGDASTDPPFRLPEISHRFRRASADVSAAADVKAASAASCALDVTCYPAWDGPASAVALIVFESDGGTYQCSGALLNSESGKPYFLTANHCVAKDDEARSVIAYFRYQTPACNGTPPRLSTLPRVAGASIAATQPMASGDFTLLELSGFPQTDVKTLGWYSGTIASSESVTGISHPRGDFKRIAFGQRTRDVSIRFDDGATMPWNIGYQVQWFDGVTQGGSSGSPLLANIDGQEYLIGSLTAGPDINEDDSAQVCRVQNLNASYGRFSVAFPYVSPFLGGAQNSGTTAAATASLAATPNPLTLGAGRAAGTVVLNWRASGTTAVQVRVGSPNGTPMTGIEPAVGSATTGDWVTDGLTFYLQDASTGNSAGSVRTLASVTVRVAAAFSGVVSGTLTAMPSIVRPAAGETWGHTTLTWKATGTTRVQVRVGSPAGTPLTGLEPAVGSATTGDWVTNGMTFYLQDASSGNSSGASKTMARITVTRMP